MDPCLCGSVLNEYKCLAVSIKVKASTAMADNQVYEETCQSFSNCEEEKNEKDTKLIHHNSGLITTTAIVRKHDKDEDHWTIIGNPAPGVPVYAVRSNFTWTRWRKADSFEFMLGTDGGLYVTNNNGSIELTQMSTPTPGDLSRDSNDPRKFVYGKFPQDANTIKVKNQEGNEMYIVPKATRQEKKLALSDHRYRWDIIDS